MSARRGADSAGARRGLRLRALLGAAVVGGVACAPVEDVAGVVAGDGAGGAVDATGVRVGFHASPAAVEPFPAPERWIAAAAAFAARLPGAAPGGLWSVGTCADGATCALSFPLEGTAPPAVEPADEDANEAALTAFDAAGLAVWLEVEPGEADVPTLIDRILERYGHHGAVAGLAVDAEQYRASSFAEGAAVSDAEAAAWRDRVRAHDAGYTLLLKHWLPERMPPTEREGIGFVDDSQRLPSEDALVAELALWGTTFAPQPVLFQVGFPSDAPWWRALEDPPGELAQALLGAAENTAGVFWVGTTIDEVL